MSEHSEMIRPYTDEDRRVYDQLAAEMQPGTSHGTLFQTRPMDAAQDPLGLLHVDAAYLPARPFDPERFDWLKKNVLWKFLITEGAYGRLVDGLDETLQSDLVREHTEGLGHGSVAWVSNHISYADIAVMMTARTEVSVRHGVENPTDRHLAVASRLVSLFRFDLLRDNGEPAYIVDDGLHDLGGYLQTVPASASGRRVKQIISHRDPNEAVRRDFARLLNKGSEFLIAASGTQDKPNEDGTQLVMDTVSHGTVGLLTKPNEVKGAERLLAVPLFMDCNPFLNGFQAVDASFRFLAPRFLYDEANVTATMEEIAEVGNEIKHPNTLEIVYDRPTIVDHALGRLGVKGDKPVY